MRDVYTGSLEWWTEWRGGYTLLSVQACVWVSAWMLYIRKLGCSSLTSCVCNIHVDGWPQIVGWHVNSSPSSIMPYNAPKDHFFYKCSNQFVQPQFRDNQRIQPASICTKDVCPSLVLFVHTYGMCKKKCNIPLEFHTVKCVKDWHSFHSVLRFHPFRQFIPPHSGTLSTFSIHSALFRTLRLFCTYARPYI